jgi:hypothetical protein
MILQKFKAASESPKDDTLEMEGVGNVRR